jgi:hypothetical protein
MRFQVLEVSAVMSGTEHAKGRKEGDLKEFWHFGQYVKIQNTLQNILKM